MYQNRIPRPAAGCAALLLASAPLLLAPSHAQADDRTKAQIEREEATTTPNKAQVEHRESVQRTGSGAAQVDVPTPAPTSGDNGAAAWQLALSAALGAVLDCGYNSFAWSPDGTRLMTKSPEGSVILDLAGDVVGRVEGAAPANGSMSWSPDGTQVLVYRSATSDYALADPRTGRTVPLSRPAPSARPMGWAGSRIVWLTGGNRNQALVSTAVDGSELETWVRLVVDQPVLAVEWSRDLAGSPAR